LFHIANLPEIVDHYADLQDSRHDIAFGLEGGVYRRLFPGPPAVTQVLYGTAATLSDAEGVMIR